MPVFIEQEIKEGLAQGKKPYSIGKELAAWVEKLFEANIPANTLKKRAQRMAAKELGTNVPNHITHTNHSENEEKRQNQVFTNEKGQFEEGTAPGPGRPPKYPKEPQLASQAIDCANMAINQLSRIEDADPNREEALQKVINWTERYKDKNVAVKPLTMPMQFARMAIQQLERMDRDHPDRKAALKIVTQWIKENL